MNNSPSKILKSCLLCAAGLFTYGCAIFVVIRANVGVAPWDVLCFGVSGTFNMLYGNASVLISALIIVIDLFMGEKIGIGTILDAVIVGKTVDLLDWIDGRVGLLPYSEALWVSVVMLLIAFIFEGIAQMIYMKAGLSCGPRDSLQIAVGRRMPRISIGVVNIFILCFVLLVGWLLGGPVGIGTLICPVGIGLGQVVVFKVFKFEPKDVTHQNIIESIRVLFDRGTGFRGKGN